MDKNTFFFFTPPLRAFNELYEALCGVHMYDYMCLKVSVNYSQPVRVFFFFVQTEWVKMILKVLNLEGHPNCMISSKVTTIVTPLKRKSQKLPT